MVKRKFSGSSIGKKKARYSRVQRNFRSGKMGLITTTRTLELSPVTVGSTDVTGALEFKLNQLPNYADFGTLFDEYMITGVKIIFQPGFTSHAEYETATGGGTYINMPTIMTAIDYDDATAINKDDLLSNESSIIHAPGQRVERFVKVKCSTAYWSGATATGYGSAQRQWLDTQGSPGVSHYGLKYVVSPGNAVTSDMKIRAFVKFYLKFRKCIG